MRRALVAAAVLRAVLSFVAIPLAPFLYREHAAVLVLLRPTKETLLFAGFSAHNGDLALGVAVIAALPILLLGVWQFFALGRVYRHDLAKKELPGLAGRVLPRARVRRIQGALEDRGGQVVFLGRLAAMPSSLVAASAGAAGYAVRSFLLIDAAGALASMALMLGLGWILEDAYESAGPWLTAVGLLALVAAAVSIGRALTREPATRRGRRGASSRQRSGSGRRRSHRRRRAAPAHQG